MVDVDIINKVLTSLYENLPKYPFLFKKSLFDQLISDKYLSGRVKPKEPKQAVYLIQGLDPADIGVITVGKEPEAIKLVRQQNHFVVADKDNYPASTTEINNLINSDLRTPEGQRIYMNVAAFEN